MGQSRTQPGALGSTEHGTNHGTRGTACFGGGQRQMSWVTVAACGPAAGLEAGCRVPGAGRRECGVSRCEDDGRRTCRVQDGGEHGSVGGETDLQNFTTILLAIDVLGWMAIPTEPTFRGKPLRHAPPNFLSASALAILKTAASGWTHIEPRRVVGLRCIGCQGRPTGSGAWEHHESRYSVLRRAAMPSVSFTKMRYLYDSVWEG